MLKLSRKKYKISSKNNNGARIAELLREIINKRKESKILDHVDDRHFLFLFLVTSEEYSERKTDEKITSFIQAIKKALLAVYQVTNSHTYDTKQRYLISTSSSFMYRNYPANTSQHALEISNIPRTVYSFNPYSLSK